MNKTRFANPHGLDHPQNYSCCEDVYLMIVEALKDEVFRKVVRTITYKAVLKYFRDGKVFCRPIFWTNTNRLLEKSEIYGIKTGITNKAGGCLATLLLMNHLNEALIIVLGSNSAESRFKDTLKIINWAFE